uniref:Gelsolin-like domain-containing protein n=1 Tax=Parastrongyloides trichosuri TaxID=131310 RepID=A0A0N4ZJV9_PARTI
MSLCIKECISKEKLLIWSVNELGYTLLKEDYNKLLFNESLCYVVFKLYKADVGPKYDIHLWIGSRTNERIITNGEIGVYDLDKFMKREGRFLREIQGYESILFISNFENKISYINLKSRVVHCPLPVSPFKVYRINTEENNKVTQIISDIQLLNHKDVYVFDLGGTIAVWNGPKSSVKSHVKGMHISNIIKDAEKNGGCRIEILNKEWLRNELRLLDMYRSNAIISYENKNILPDEVFEERFNAISKIYNVKVEKDFTIVIREEKKKFLTFSKDSCFLVNSKNLEIYVWLGKVVPKHIRKQIFKIIVQYLRGMKLPTYLPVIFVNEGHEPSSFYEAISFLSNYIASF